MAALRTVSVLAGASLWAAVALGDDRGVSGPAWSYAGADGPAAWGRLAPEWAACSTGEQQSPIDLSAAVPAGVQPPHITWRASAAEIVNTGRTVQVNLDDAGGVWLGDVLYELKQFHFHHDSEHAVDGRRFPLEAHFVHAAPSGGYAVIAVLFAEGEANPDLAGLWATAPAAPGRAAAPGPIDPAAFLPASARAFHYAGSLTTPPCDETVVWTVFADPAPVSAAQIAAFAQAFPNNARPLQPRNRRFVLATE